MVESGFIQLPPLKTTHSSYVRWFTQELGQVFLHPRIPLKQLTYAFTCGEQGQTEGGSGPYKIAPCKSLGWKNSYIKYICVEKTCCYNLKSSLIFRCSWKKYNDGHVENFVSKGKMVEENLNEHIRMTKGQSTVHRELMFRMSLIAYQQPNPSQFVRFFFSELCATFKLSIFFKIYILKEQLESY